MKVDRYTIIDWIFHTAILVVLILIFWRLTNGVKVSNTVDVWGSVDIVDEVKVREPLEVHVQEPLGVEIW